MRRKTRSVAADLAALRAPMATRIDASGRLWRSRRPRCGPATSCWCARASERAADGVVLTGRSEIDESLVTGETRRRLVGSGATVHAGVLNYDGPLQVRVSAAAGDALLDHIERLIEGAAGEKARYQRLADRASRLYAPVVHLTALLTALGWWVAGASLHDAVVTAIAVLIITCPCALALAIPAVQVVAAGALFKSGVLSQSGDAIERLAEIDTVVFDKTDTLTLPEPSVVNAHEMDPALLQQAARLALSSRHPLAKALANEAVSRNPFDGARETPGAGIVGMIDGVDAILGSPAVCGLEREASEARTRDPRASVIAFRRGDRGAAFVIRQAPRVDAAATIAALRKRGLEVMILSGDHSAAVEAAARGVGVDIWRGEMKPDEKIAFLIANHLLWMYAPAAVAPLWLKRIGARRAAALGPIVVAGAVLSFGRAATTFEFAALMSGAGFGWSIAMSGSTALLFEGGAPRARWLAAHDAAFFAAGVAGALSASLPSP